MFAATWTLTRRASRVVLSQRERLSVSFLIANHSLRRYIRAYLNPQK